MSSGDFVGPVGNATAKYSQRNPAARALQRRFLREVDAAAEATGAATVLDVGCGEGVVTERLARLLRDTQVVGIDADNERLRSEWQSRSRENLSFRTGSAYQLPYEAKTFDLVCALEVLEHLERPSDALTEMARVARCSLLVSVPREPLWRILHMLGGRDLRRLGNTDGHINHWSSDDFSRLVSQFGRVERIRRPVPWTMIVVDLRGERS